MDKIRVIHVNKWGTFGIRYPILKIVHVQAKFLFYDALVFCRRVSLEAVLPLEKF